MIKFNQTPTPYIYLLVALSSMAQPVYCKAQQEVPTKKRQALLSKKKLRMRQNTPVATPANLPATSMLGKAKKKPATSSSMLRNDKHALKILITALGAAIGGVAWGLRWWIKGGPSEPFKELAAINPSKKLYRYLLISCLSLISIFLLVYFQPGAADALFIEDETVSSWTLFGLFGTVAFGIFSCCCGMLCTTCCIASLGEGERREILG